MHLSATTVRGKAALSGKEKRQSGSIMILTTCMFFVCMSGSAHAEVITVLDFDFETDAPNFQIQLQETGDATASFEYGDVGGSRGLIFKGTYQTKNGVDVFEYGNGILVPVPPTSEDFHLYPSEIDGINSITVSWDAIVDGLPSDNENSNGVMGVSLQLWQVKDGNWDIYQITRLFTNLTWAEVELADLTAEDFKRAEDDAIPDFSSTAEPIVFGFFVGIGYKWVSGPGAFISTSARVDNWFLEADVGQTVFEDGFEKIELPVR